jgi:hypothetical protein
MRTLSMFRTPTAFLPVMMSLAALAVVLSYLVLHGPAPQADEGAAAHVWQLLMAGQVPIMALFAIIWSRKAPREASMVLAVQIIAAMAAMAPVFILHW